MDATVFVNFCNSDLYASPVKICSYVLLNKYGGTSDLQIICNIFWGHQQKQKKTTTIMSGQSISGGIGLVNICNSAVYFIYEVITSCLADSYYYDELNSFVQ